MMRALAITGPTASGKTALSIMLAREISGEIISCDSMQIYKEMNIGTAKASEEERAAVAHHLIDFVSPADAYSSDNYREDALRAARDIISRGRVPIFVGGTGLYLDTVARAASEVLPSDPAYREALLSEEPSVLWERLRAIDPDSAEKIHKNNVKRVIRALEIYDATGKTKTYFDEITKTALPPIKIKMITLDFHDRDRLYRRIDLRVDEMFDTGLLDEAHSLYERGFLSPDTTAGQAIGYKELVDCFEGRASLETVREQIKLASRRYAKRQLTWFRRNEAYRLYLDGELCERGASEVYDELISVAKSILKEENF